MPEIPGVASRIPIRVVSGYVDSATGMWEAAGAVPAEDDGTGNPAPGVPDPAGTCLFLPIDSFLAPANAAQYPLYTLIANSATAGSVVPLTFAPSTRGMGITGCVRRARLRTTELAAASLVIRLQLFSSGIPTVTNGDHSAFVSSFSGHIGHIDIQMDKIHIDGCSGHGYPAIGNEMNFVPAFGTDRIYGLLENRTAWTPTGGKIWEVQLEIYSN